MAAMMVMVLIVVVVVMIMGMSESAMKGRAGGHLSTRQVPLVEGK